MLTGFVMLLVGGILKDSPEWLTITGLILMLVIGTTLITSGALIGFAPRLAETTTIAQV